MKKTFSVIALVAIVAMLFTACAPQPATEEQIAVANELLILVGKASVGGKISTPTNPLDYTISLTEEYTDPVTGDKLTAYTQTLKVSGDISDLQNATAKMTMTVKGVIAGNSHSLSVSATASPDGSYSGSAKIDGKNVTLDSLQNIPGV